MPGNSFGKIFQITTFGESHGAVIGVVIDGCPAGITIDLEQINVEMIRRRPGQSEVTTSRNEADEVEIMTGLFEGKTTGMPIMMLIKNKDQRSKDYSNVKDVFRPSHADYVYAEKYGVRDYRGGGRSSARETACRVAAGALANQVIKHFVPDYDCLGFVSRVGEVFMSGSVGDFGRAEVEANIVRCPDSGVAEEMIELIKEVKADGDTVGGVVSCVVKGVPVGLGEPVFDRLNADLAKAMTSINAVKGFEIGSGFEGVKMRGSEHNDAFYKDEEGRIRTRTNNSGGVQGGISNGEDIYFNVAFKPVATLMKEQDTVSAGGDGEVVRAVGRHDPCVVPRAVVIVESMANLVILDHLLRARVSRV